MLFCCCQQSFRLGGVVPLVPQQWRIQQVKCSSAGITHGQDFQDLIIMFGWFVMAVLRVILIT